MLPLAIQISGETNNLFNKDTLQLVLFLNQFYKNIKIYILGLRERENNYFICLVLL